MLSRICEIAGIYTEAFIPEYKGISEGTAISAEVTAKWKEETDRNHTKHKKWDKVREAQQAQEDWAANKCNIEVFPVSVMMEPVSIEMAAISPTGIKSCRTARRASWSGRAPRMSTATSNTSGSIS